MWFLNLAIFYNLNTTGLYLLWNENKILLLNNDLMNIL